MKMSFLFSGVAAGVAGILFGSGTVDIYRVANAPPTEYRAMVVSELSYAADTNLITQQVYALGVDQIKADWAAKIIRGNQILCSGGGTSTYRSKEKGHAVAFNPKDWTYGNETTCTPALRLKPGDKIFATWEFLNGHNQPRTVSAGITIDEG